MFERISFGQALVIARKEVVDHSREVRSVMAALMHVLMGPLVILLVSFSPLAKNGGSGVLTAMISIFALTAVFVGGMNVAMDLLAGERERRSLVPLLLNPVSRLTVVTGKWAATALYALGGAVLTLAGFTAVARGAGPLFSASGILCWMVLGLAPLSILAAALQVAISTACRTAKEAQTYLSLLIFVPMGVAMFLVFFPQKFGSWAALTPIAGHQAIVQTALLIGKWPWGHALVLAAVTCFLTAGVLVLSGKLLERDNVVYGS